jgi:hypothetical protein
MARSTTAFLDDAIEKGSADHRGHRLHIRVLDPSMCDEPLEGAPLSRPEEPTVSGNRNPKVERSVRQRNELNGPPTKARERVGKSQQAPFHGIQRNSRSQSHIEVALGSWGATRNRSKDDGEFEALVRLENAPNRGEVSKRGSHSRCS